MCRIELVRNNPKLSLELYLDQLTERELKVAAQGAPKTAFSLRHFADGRRHAILLANCYPASLLTPRCNHEPDFVLEVKDSVCDHFRIWRQAHDRSIHELFHGIESVLGIHFTGPELLRLSDSLGRGLRKELLEYIASAI